MSTMPVAKLQARGLEVFIDARTVGLKAGLGRGQRMRAGQTLLPYLADPTRFMFLKPEPTKECAARLRFDLKYDSSLERETYARLMILSDQLLKRLHPLGARDFIDVQSFMWVVSKYPAS